MRVADVRSSMTALEEFLASAEPMLRRAFAARYGLQVGREASADAVAWAVEHWPELSAMNNPIGYLFRVGQTSARRQRRWTRPDIIVPNPVTDVVVDVDLQRALQRLRPEERVAVLLVHGFGYRYRDVAQILQIPDTTVTNHIRRGLARLRTLMELS